MNIDYCKHMVPIMKNDTCHICSLEAERDRLRKELEEARKETQFHRNAAKRKKHETIRFNL